MLTHFISRSVKIRVSTTMRKGTVRMRMNGKAREAAVDMTAQSRARQSSCRAVNRCIRMVRTCRDEVSLNPAQPAARTGGLPLPGEIRTTRISRPPLYREEANRLAKAGFRCGN